MRGESTAPGFGRMTIPKEATPAAPKSTLFLRASSRDRLLMLAGINPIVANYRLGESGRRSANVARVWSSRFDPGEYSQAMMDDLLTVRERLMNLKSYARLRFDTSFQIAGCAMAVRIATKNHRHGHPMPQIPKIGTAAKRLLNRLETLRKRAKRAELRQLGADVYRQKTEAWRRFIVWIRTHLTDCKCIPRRKVTSGRSRLIVSTLVNWTRTELKNRRAQVPDEPELRKLVRLALRYVRRGRKGYGVRDLLDDKVFAASQLATFVTLRVEKASNRRQRRRR